MLEIKIKLKFIVKIDLLIIFLLNIMSYYVISEINLLRLLMVDKNSTDLKTFEIYITILFKSTINCSRPSKIVIFFFGNCNFLCFISSFMEENVFIHVHFN